MKYLDFTLLLLLTNNIVWINVATLKNNFFKKNLHNEYYKFILPNLLVKWMYFVYLESRAIESDCLCVFFGLFYWPHNCVKKQQQKKNKHKIHLQKWGQKPQFKEKKTKTKQFNNIMNEILIIKISL